jgi:cyclohexa-1,5-dienecarbonyl-CoA hydratase
VTSEAELRVWTSDDGARTSLTLAHPKGNIITRTLVDMIDAALDELAAASHLKLVTIEGQGVDFSFGASIPEHAPGEIEEVLPRAHALIEKLLAFPAPTAALVRGRCLGGGFEIALACDFIFAEASATFGLPEIALGVFPPAASVLLPARVGAARATAALLTGARTGAVAWHQAGLIAEISRDGALSGDVDRWFAANLSGHSAAALRYAVTAARVALRQEVRARLPELERLYLGALMKTADAHEGVAAFLEKRLPRWTDR